MPSLQACALRGCCRSGSTRFNISPMRRRARRGRAKAVRALAVTATSVLFFQPAGAMLREHRTRCRRPPGARRIRLRRFVRTTPLIQDRLDPAPCGFLFVTSHEEREAAVDHVEQQTLIRLHLAFAEEPVEREIEVDAC